MPSGEEKQHKSDKLQRRCLLCNRSDDFTLNTFDRNVANDVKTLFQIDIECKETRKICLHCLFSIKFIKLSAKHEQQPTQHHHQHHQPQQQQHSTQHNNCCKELFENPVYLREIRKKYRRYVERVGDYRKENGREKEKEKEKEREKEKDSSQSHTSSSASSSSSSTSSSSSRLSTSSLSSIPSPEYSPVKPKNPPKPSNSSSRDATQSSDKSTKTITSEKTSKADKRKIHCTIITTSTNSSSSSSVNGSASNISDNEKQQKSKDLIKDKYGDKYSERDPKVSRTSSSDSAKESQREKINSNIEIKSKSSETNENTTSKVKRHLREVEKRLPQQHEPPTTNKEKELISDNSNIDNKTSKCSNKSTEIENVVEEDLKEPIIYLVPEADVENTKTDKKSSQKSTQELNSKSKSKSKLTKLPTNTRKTIVFDLTKSPIKAKTPVHIPSKQQKVSSFAEALLETVSKTNKRRSPVTKSITNSLTEPSVSKTVEASDTPLDVMITSTETIKPTELKESVKELTKSKLKSKTLNYVTVNGMQIELPDGVEKNSKWFKCFIPIDRMNVETTKKDEEIESTVTPPPAKRRRRKLEIEKIGQIEQQVQVNNSNTAIKTNEMVGRNSCHSKRSQSPSNETILSTPKSILLRQNRSQTPLSAKKRVSFINIAESDDDDETMKKSKKIFIKEKRSIEKKSSFVAKGTDIKGKPSKLDKCEEVNNVCVAPMLTPILMPVSSDEIKIVPAPGITGKPRRKKSQKNDKIQLPSAEYEKSSKTDKSIESVGRTINTTNRFNQNSIMDESGESDACVAVTIAAVAIVATAAVPLENEINESSPSIKPLNIPIVEKIPIENRPDLLTTESPKKSINNVDNVAKTCTQTENNATIQTIAPFLSPSSMALSSLPPVDNHSQPEKDLLSATTATMTTATIPQLNMPTDTNSYHEENENVIDDGIGHTVKSKNAKAKPKRKKKQDTNKDEKQKIRRKRRQKPENQVESIDEPKRTPRSKPKRHRKVKKSITNVIDHREMAMSSSEIFSNILPVDMNEIINGKNDIVPMETKNILNDSNISNGSNIIDDDKDDDEITFVNDTDPLAFVNEPELLSPIVTPSPFKMPEVMKTLAIDDYDSVPLRIKISNGRVLNAKNGSPITATPAAIITSISPSKVSSPKAGAMHRMPRAKKKKADPDFIASDDLSVVEEDDDGDDDDDDKIAMIFNQEKKKRKVKQTTPKRRNKDQLHFRFSPSPKNVFKEKMREKYGSNIFDSYVKLNRNPNIDQGLFGDGSVRVKFETPNHGPQQHCMESPITNEILDSSQIMNAANEVVSNNCDTPVIINLNYSNVKARGGHCGSGDDDDDDVDDDEDVDKEDDYHEQTLKNVDRIVILENIRLNGNTGNIETVDGMDGIENIENNQEIYEPDSMTTIHNDDFTMHLIQEPLISVGNNCAESPLAPVLSEVEPNAIGFESPTATVDSTTSGYSSATTTSTICSLEHVPVQFSLSTHDVAMPINSYVTSNLHSNYEDDEESNSIYFSNIANCVEIGTSLEQINADDIISVLGKPSDGSDLNMEDDMNMGAFDETTSQSPTHSVGPRNYYFSDYNPLNAFSGHSMSSTSGIVFRTKAALKQIDLPGMVSLNDSYCSSLSSTASIPSELSTKLLRNDNPLLNHHSTDMDESAIEIQEASSSFSTVADSMVTSSETISVSASTARRQELNITISTPSKGAGPTSDLHHGDMIFDIFEENRRQLLNAENFPTTTTPVEPPFDLNPYQY